MEWKDSYILATADISSLYTIISHQQEAVRHYLKSDNLVVSQREFVFSLLDFAMGRNYFWFGWSYYLQDRGLAMGAKFALSMAYLFMAKWEENAVYARPRPELILWKRYIDDVLLIWDGEQCMLDEFMARIPSNFAFLLLALPSNTPSKRFYEGTEIYCVMIGSWDLFFQSYLQLCLGVLSCSNFRSLQM